MLRPSEGGAALARNNFVYIMFGNSFVKELDVLSRNWLDWPCKRGAPNLDKPVYTNVPAPRKRKATSNFEKISKVIRK